VQLVADAPIIDDHPTWPLHFKAAGAGSHSPRVANVRPPAFSLAYSFPGFKNFCSRGSVEWSRYYCMKKCINFNFIYRYNLCLIKIIF
jgi:hypothetical protein